MTDEERQDLLRALRDPSVGVVVGTVGVLLITFLRAVLQHSEGGRSLDFTFLLSLIVTVVVGRGWGRAAALVVGGIALVLGFTYNERTLIGRQVLGSTIFALASGMFVYALDREQRARADAEAQAASLAEERDRLTRAQAEAQAAHRRAEQSAAEQREVLERLQSHTLAASDPNIKGLTFSLAYEPASSAAMIGGDFYNILRLSDTSAAVVLGDITGKGGRAAADGLIVSNMLRAFFAESRSPADVLRRLNRALVEDPDFTSLATLFAATLDGETNTLVYANAGQETPCLLSPWGVVTPLEAAGPPVGSFADAEYAEGTHTVPRGHTLIAFTDGLTEVRLPDGSWMDPRRTYVKLAELAGSPPSAITRQMIAWARTVSGGNLRDDAALLAITFED